MKFCPICNYSMLVKVENTQCIRTCIHCGNSETVEKGEKISETLVKERSSEAYKIVMNEFTRLDPTLPRLKTIKCPRGDCPSNGGGAEKDVIYIKYDGENLKYLYICDVCGEHWRSRT